MFSFFRKRKPKTALDMAIMQIYGSLYHKKTANLEAATRIAHSDLLCECIDADSVRQKAAELYASPMPYSTNDLAVSVALAFYKDPANHEFLKEAQMVARLQLLEWVKADTVAKPIAMAFENTLYKLFKPTR